MDRPNLTRARIVAAEEADLGEIADLAAMIWRACYPGIISHAQIDYMLARMYAPQTMCQELLLQAIHYSRLFIGDAFVGFASYGPEQGLEVFKLHKLYVHPQWHRRGLGSFLLCHCEQEAIKHGAQRLILNVNKRNTKAFALYRKHGFRILEAKVVGIGSGFVMDDYVLFKEFEH